MPEMIYKTNLDERGAWLLGQEELETLDQIIDSEWQRLNAENEKEIEAEAASLAADKQMFLRGDENEIEPSELRRRALDHVRRQYPFCKSNKSITLLFKGGARLEISSFAEAAKHPDTVSQLPIGFTVSLQSGQYAVEANLDRYDYLGIRVSPDGRYVSREIFTIFARWVQKARPRRLVRIWSSLSYYGIAPFTLLFGILFCVLVTVAFAIRTENPPWPEKQRATELLQEGITAANQQEAIGICLALLAEQGKPEPVKTWTLPIRPLIISLAVILVFVLLCFPPRTVIGIGKGEQKLAHWKQYLKFVFVSIPGVVLASVLIPWVIELVKDVW